MDIKINKDIAKDYPTDVWKGFTLRQIFCILAALILGAGSVLLLYFGAGVNIHAAVYLAIPISSPLILIEFLSYKGLPVLDYLRERIRLADQPVLYYQAEENHYLYENKQEQRKKTLKQQKNKRKGSGSPWD